MGKVYEEKNADENRGSKAQTAQSPPLLLLPVFQ
jgi:hypothetical protein